MVLDEWWKDFFLVGGAFLGASWALFQFYSSRRFSHKISAKSAHLQFVKLSLDCPILANPELANIDYEEQKLNGSKVEFEKYEWYVAFMITSFEEIIENSTSKGWMNTIKGCLSAHKAYFNSKFFKTKGYEDNIDKKLWRLIGDVLNGVDGSDVERPDGGRALRAERVKEDLGV